MATGRREAYERAAWLVAGARSGSGRALLVVGDAGSGKTTLLADAATRAGDALLLRTTGVSAEGAVAHGGLHALLSLHTELLAALPDTQRQALAVALGRESGPPPTPLLMGAATLTALSAAAAERPVLVLVDDAQWVDESSLQALAFAARRLSDERVGIVLTARSEQVPPALEGIESVVLDELSEQEAAQLLHDVALGPGVLRELLAATGGNALALVEMASSLDDEQRAGLRPLPRVPPRGSVFSDRVSALPPHGLDAAGLVGLAEGLSASALEAARRVTALGAEALRPAEESGLLAVSAEGVKWRHTLARAEVLEALGPARRRELAAVLARTARDTGAPESVTVELELEAAEGQDEQLALRLEALATSSETSGDYAGAARSWSRASRVGTDSTRFGLRLLGSAEATLRNGGLAAALLRYDAALATGLGDADRSRAHLARGRIMHTNGSPRVAVADFRAAAGAARTSETQVRACAEGVLACMFAGAPESAITLADEAEAAHDPTRPAERLLVLHARGAALALSGSPEQGRPLLEASVQVAETTSVLQAEPELVLWVVTAPLFAGGDPNLGDAVAAPALDELRRRGDLLWLPRVIRLWGVRQFLAGRLLAAFATTEEAAELSRAAGQRTQLVEALGVLAFLEAVRGEEGSCLAHVEELEAVYAGLDVPFLSAHGWRSEGLLRLGRGEARAAADVLGAALQAPKGIAWRAEAVADLVEALVLEGRKEEARAALEQAWSPQGAGLVEDDDERAIALLLQATGAALSPFEKARCQLLLGERLRRTGQRVEARTHLRAAAEQFRRSGADPWQRRAQEGLRASGESLRRGAEADIALTGAELRVAGLVAQGRPTREVATLLFLSPKTVEFHLSRIYRKLGVRGRAELARRLTEQVLADTSTAQA
ncbi:MAG TPA: AAA family ATPase [Mycobacteriales bacterium]|nr:AAA family ATPase [Mycobacteriales bacterium]